MTLELSIRYVHFLGIFLLAATLITQNLWLGSRVEKHLFRKLVTIDGVYGASAAVVILTGLTMWLWVGKPSVFYTQNNLFLLKFGLFIVVGLLSAVPTLFFIRQRKSTREFIDIPSILIGIKRLELALLMFIPLLAVLMARGIQW